MNQRRRIDPDDETAFEAAREDLLTRFAASSHGPPDGDTFVAGCMVDFQRGVMDGPLGHWTTDHIEDLLLEYFPRKVTLEPEDLPLVAGQAIAFLRFLHGAGELTGDPLARLEAHVLRLDDDFRAAMADDTGFGMAKRIVRQMTLEGVDPTSPGAIDAWMTDFNARPRAERDAVLGALGLPPLGDGPEDADWDDADEDDEAELPPERPLPLLRPPPDAELDAAAAASVTMGRVAAFTRFVQQPRKLTSKGHLTLADGRILAGELGLEDEFDPTYGSSRTWRTRSTGEVRGITLTFAWARAAGFVKVRHGRVSATARGQRVGDRPREDWAAVLEAWLGGKVEIRSSRFFRWEDDILEELLYEVPRVLYRVAGLPVESLHQVAVELLETRYVIGPPGELYDPRALVPTLVDHFLVEPLVDLGAATVDEGVLSATALGLWGINGWLRAQGFDAPLADHLPGLAAVPFLEQCAMLDLEEADTEIQRWVAARPATAAAELADAARTGELRLLALHALGFAGPAAEGAVRGMLAEPDLRPIATLWLVQRGHLSAQSLPPEDLQSVFVEVVASLSDDEGPDAMVTHVGSLGPPEEQRAFIEGLLRAPHPRTTDVLLAIGRLHPDKTIAKTARTIAFKRQGLRLN